MYEAHAVKGLSTLAVKHALQTVARQKLIPHPKDCENCSHSCGKTWFCGEFKHAVVASAKHEVHRILAAKVRGLQYLADKNAELMARGIGGTGRRRTKQVPPMFPGQHYQAPITMFPGQHYQVPQYPGQHYQVPQYPGQHYQVPQYPGQHYQVPQYPR
jgi:hypothetical protein